MTVAMLGWNAASLANIFIRATVIYRRLTF
jgi:hypothetical protein